MQWKKQIVWASGLNLYKELTPAHLCYSAEKPKGVNDEMSERHLGAFRDALQVILHSHNVKYMTELPWLHK